MRVFTRRLKKDEHTAFTIGTMDAQLNEDVIKEYKLGPALRRIGIALAKQYARRKTRDGKDEVVGVNVTSLGFNLLLARQDAS